MVTEIIEKHIKLKHTSVKWSKEEDEIVKLNYKNNIESIKLIIQLIKQQFNRNRTIISVRHEATKLNLTKPERYDLWTENENLIVQNYFNGTKTNNLLIQEKIKREFGIDRTIPAIQRRAFILGLSIKKPSIWTNYKLNLLQNMTGKYTAQEIADKLEISLQSVYHKTQTLKYKLGFKHRTDWYTMGDVCVIFGVSSKTIKQWMRRKILIYDEFQSGVYRFLKKNLRNFICTYALELNGRNVDLFQIVSILCPNYSSGKIDKYL